MRGVVIYVRYVVIPAIAVIAGAWMVHIIGKIANKISDKRDNRR